MNKPLYYGKLVLKKSTDVEKIPLLKFDKSVLMELRNHNGKLFLCPPKKWSKTQLLFFKVNSQFGPLN